MSHDHREAIAEVLALAVCRCEHDAETHSNYGGCLHPDCRCPYNATTVRADALLGSDVLAQIRADARAEALDDVLTRACDGIEFGPKNYLLLRRIVRDVRAGGSA